MTQSALRALERCETCSDGPCGFLPPQRDDCAIVHAEVHEMVHDLADVPIRERQRRAICQDSTGVWHKPHVHKSRKSESESIFTGLADELLVVDREGAVVEGVLERLVHDGQVGEVVCNRGRILSGWARRKRDREKASPSESYPRTIRCPTTGTVDGPACRRGSCSLNAQACMRRAQRQGC